MTSTVSKNNKWLTGAALLFVLSEFAMILVYVSNPQVSSNFGFFDNANLMNSIPWSNFSELPRVENLVIVVETLAASGDLFIAGVLCFILLRSRTGFSRSDTMIKKLVIFFINTGLLTSLFAIGSLVALTVAPTTFIYIVLFFCMGRLYSNSLLAILNARSIIRTGTDEVLTSRDLPLSLQPRSTGSMRPDANVTIRIETTHDTASDKDIKSASHPGGHFDHFSSSRI
ncbi:hypothetical protein B0H10DRAFT_2218530 [Mycena sp. CBHHK59/15]|nr:hypothetical protein B0H10DRAFT_2218530 [Mycena sp. CBHHK59/15]